jgi:hypothetical protein
MTTQDPQPKKHFTWKAFLKAALRLLGFIVHLAGRVGMALFAAYAHVVVLKVITDVVTNPGTIRQTAWIILVSLLYSEYLILFKLVPSNKKK